MTEAELAKCGCDPESFKKGSYVHLHAMAKITEVVHVDSSERDGKSSRVELQIEGLAIESEDEEHEEK